MRISGRCRISSTGIITGKIHSGEKVIGRSSGCIFLSGDKQVYPVRKNGDQNQFDKITKIFTFTRTTTTRANDMGRAEMSFCFTKPRSSLFTGFNKYQKRYLSHTKQIDQYCPNAVHKTSVATQGTYKLEVYIPNDTGTATAKSTIAQWHGRPRRLVYKDSLGSVQDLTNPISSVNNLSTLNTAKAAYDAVITAGGKFNQGGYPPLTARIEFNKFVVVARYDNRKYNEKSVRCNLNKATYAVDTTKKCRNTGSEKVYVTVIYRESLTSWLDQWKTLKLVVNWKPLGQNSRVRVYVDGKQVKDWSGLLGRNDEYGPYMKYGIYAPSRSRNFRIKIKNASSVVSNST